MTTSVGIIYHETGFACSQTEFQPITEGKGFATSISTKKRNRHISHYTKIPRKFFRYFITDDATKTELTPTYKMWDNIGKKKDKRRDIEAGWNTARLNAAVIHLRIICERTIKIYYAAGTFSLQSVWCPSINSTFKTCGERIWIGFWNCYYIRSRIVCEDLQRKK